MKALSLEMLFNTQAFLKEFNFHLAVWDQIESQLVLIESQLVLIERV